MVSLFIIYHKIIRFTAKNRVERINDEIDKNLILDNIPSNTQTYFYPKFRETNKN